MLEQTKVYLVGSGPSGVDLLTLRAAKLLGSADLIVYDALVDASIHRLFNPRAEHIYVGKRAGQHALQQEEINALLIDLAQRHPGAQIIRLKGGDPFVFGRGGEEMQALRKAYIPFEIVPGITAGIASPAYFGVPVTHRGISRSVTLITAFSKEGGLPDLDWEAYSRLDGTLVFYMSMRVVPQIVKALINAGMSPTREAAIISHGTRPEQRIEIHELREFTEGRYDYSLFSPGIFVVGEVLSFAREHAWYEPSPLAGKKVLITRSEGQSSALCELFEAEGAEPLVLPSFEIQPCLSSDSPLIGQELGDVALALSSPNAVDYFVQHLQREGLDTRYLARFDSIIAIGPGTATALEKYGLRPDLIAPKHTAEGLAELIITSAKWKRVYLPTSQIGGTELEDRLKSAGIEVLRHVVYENIPIDYKREELEALLRGGVDWITFCSSSAVHNFIALIEKYELRELLDGQRLAAIGPSTAESIRGYGYPITVEPSNPSLKNLVEAMKHH